MAANCPEVFEVCFTRVAQLDVNGSPLTGANHGYVSDGLIKAELDFDYEEGQEKVMKNGCGTIIATARADDHLKRAKVTLTIGYLDYELITMLVGGTRITSGGQTFGFMSQFPNATAPFGVCLEMWARAWDDDAQAINSGGIGANVSAYHHFVFPRFKSQLGKFNLEDDFSQIPLVGYSTSNTRVTADGPFNDWPTAIKNLGGITAPWGVFFDGTTPTAACGSITVTSAAS